jgi:large subunit ribosomal protein L10Ae
MSKLDAEQVEEVINAIKAGAETKKRNFLETIELQVALKNYDPQKDKRFSGSITLPFIPRDKFSVCVLGSASDCDRAKACGVESRSVEDLKKLNKNKKLVKKLAAEFSAFLASSALIRKIPRLLGPGLNKAGKFPGVLGDKEDISAKVNDLKASVKFQLKSKKTTCMGVAISNVALTTDQTAQNVILAVNFLVSLLPKNWQQVKKLYLKSTMGPSHKIYGF